MNDKWGLNDGLSGVLLITKGGWVLVIMFGIELTVSAGTKAIVGSSLIDMNCEGSLCY